MSELKKYASKKCSQIKRGGFSIISGALFKAIKYISLSAPLFFVLILVRLLRPLIVVRVGALLGSRIGHFAANTELYLCEQKAGINVPSQPHIDILKITKPVSNKQLEKMWRRVIPHIWPDWLVQPAIRINRVLPFGGIHEIGYNTQNDRDVHNLYEQVAMHLDFTMQEEILGKTTLREMGIPDGAQFICVTVRDSAYLDEFYRGQDYSYHDYRDCNVNNYVQALEALANRGYYVVRMGVKVKEPILCDHPNVIDYATNGMRTDFMDIYLGAKCLFCVTNGTGFDAVPMIFRRPIVQVNSVPAGYAYTWGNNTLLLFKHHVNAKNSEELTLLELFKSGVGYALHSDEYISENIKLIENSPDEIRDVVIEMVERLEGTWVPSSEDDLLHKKFWEVYPINAMDPYKGRPLHGKISARYSSSYLRDNPWWLN